MHPLESIPCHPQSPMQQVLALAHILAPHEAPILIQGASGTGKEVLAQALHRASQRSKGPFIAINCGALVESLLEAELFGAVKGAYTGAHEDRPGKIRASDQGTLFLDEIGELPLSAQTRLLRVLQEKAVCPVGGIKEIAVDFRLICATHVDLHTAVQQGRFRLDLLHRLQVLPLHLPSLAERPMDIPLFAQKIWDSLPVAKSPNSTKTQAFKALNPQELHLLSQQNWPGNLRELHNVLLRYSLVQQLGWTLEQALTLPSLAAAPGYSQAHVVPPPSLGRGSAAPQGQGPAWDSQPENADFQTFQTHGRGSALQGAFHSPTPPNMTENPSLKQQWMELERKHLQSVLIKHRFRKSPVAKELGISRSTLDRRIRDLAIPLQ